MARGRRRLRRLRDLARHEPGRPRPVRQARSRQPDPAAVEAGGRLARGRSHMDGAPSSRRRATSSSASSRMPPKDGLAMKTGVECEFFLITPDGTDTGRHRRPAGEALLRPVRADATLRRHRRDLRRDAGAWLGPYQNDHEDANGQFEMNWHYADALVTADRHAFFKYMARSIAEKHGLRATFMPKPFANLTGSGCHAHVSLWQGRHERLRGRRTASSASRRPATISSAASSIRPKRWRRSPTRR